MKKPFKPLFLRETEALFYHRFIVADEAAESQVKLRNNGYETERMCLRFILLSGPRLNEPIAWGGPIVMNTSEELDQAFQDLDEGTFIKERI